MVPKTTQQLLEDPNAIATSLLIALVDEFGTEFFEWEPDTVIQEVETHWKVKIPQHNKDKIWALVTYLTTNLFMNSFEAFTHICNSLIGAGASFQVYDPATVEEMCWAITETTLLEPWEEGETFNAEIATYMQLRIEEEGFARPPRILAKFVAPVPENTEAINSALEIEGHDYKAYWLSQQSMRYDLEQSILSRLSQLVQEITTLPLQNASAEGIQQLRDNADKLLATQQKLTQQASETAPPTPFQTDQIPV